MDDEDKYKQFAHLPIPTYEEATSSRPSSSQNYRGPEEISDDAERQGLLGREPGVGAYRPPIVESARSSVDSDLRLPEVTRDGDDARRQIEELDYLDPSGETPQGQRGLYHRARLRTSFSKHLANLSATFSSIRLPSFRSLYSSVPDGEPASAAEHLPSRFAWLTSVGRRWSIPEQYRMSAPTFARLCALFTLASLVYVLFALDMFPQRRFGRPLDPESVRAIVQESVSGDDIAGYLLHITSFDHVAGTEGDLFLAKWMEELWLENGGFDDVELLEYYVYLNYPTPDGRSVKIVAPEDQRWEALLEEESVNPKRKQTLAWHGHSKSGHVKGPLIYANGGSRDDFAWLQSNGVETNGSIALIRYYGTQGDRALKIKAAEEAGCSGVLIYSDPSDDGSAMGPVWPDGPWRPEDSLQRGGVSLMSWVVGDPLTPGWASTKGAKVVPKEQSAGLVQIPSLPLAWRDAKVLVDALHGRGVEVPESWVGGTEQTSDKWFSGDGGASDGRAALPEVELKNINDENEKQRIWNLHGLISGLEEPERRILIGNHRDSWCFGAVDPGSGSAIMMEVIAIFGQLRKIGWRPLRTIEFVSWDAEEYNLVGSTEYVEDNIDYLRQNAIAYLNVDVGVYGSDFHASGSPLWKRALLHVLDRVSDPNSNGTLRQKWDEEKSDLEGLGAGSDYVAFQDMAGTSSIDFGFKGPDYGFPYHSCYETFDWMRNFGDPNFAYHHTLAQVWALLILEISDRPLIPFDLNMYADAIQLYIKQLQQYAEEAYGKMNSGKVVSPELLTKLTGGFDLEPMRAALHGLRENVGKFHQFENIWASHVFGAGGLETANMALKRLDYNNRLANFETDLLDLPTDPDDKGPHGVPGREQFKHVIFGPQAWSGYDEAFFPAIRDAIDVGDWGAAQVQVGMVARTLTRASSRLVDGWPCLHGC